MSTKINYLMKQRLAKWEQRRHLAAETAALADAQRSMIAISRDYGCMGEEIAQRVASRLGFDVYDRELIDAIADSAQVRTQVVESVGEMIQQDITAWIDDQVEGGYFTSTDYLQQLSKVILTVARHGDAIILGRGAQFILDPERTLRVRATASQEVRVQRIADAAQMSLKEARASMRRSDASRSSYCRWHFNKDVTDPRYYDITLNTDSMSVDLCAELIVTAYRGRFGSGTAKEAPDATNS